MAKEGQTVVGVPFYVAQNPYQAGVVPPNAIYGDPMGAPIQQTIYRDTPAPFNCPYCGNTGLTTVRSKPSLAAFVGCMMPMFLGFCFLCPSMDCLWHKYHHCPQCSNKVADFEKRDACLVVDPSQWKQELCPVWMMSSSLFLFCLRSSQETGPYNQNNARSPTVHYDLFIVKSLGKPL